MNRPKIIIAVGGTGGHVFPAEKLASELEEKGVEVVFAGAGLATNPYLNRARFAHVEIALAKRKIGAILKGIIQSFRLLKSRRPDLVVGFGSYHSFPLLLAALFGRVPFILFESNAIPGKVIRFFSRWAKVTAIQFPTAREKLFGDVVEVKMVCRAQKKLDLMAARRHYGLDQNHLTLLVFGGSQGAAVINTLFSEAVSSLNEKIQVIHLTGAQEDIGALQKKYNECGILAAVKPFEERMDIAWSAADIAVCRSGANTVAEQLAFEVPAVFIPFPRATDDHQTENAKYAQVLGGAILFQEREIDAQKLRQGIEEVITHFPRMKSSFSTATLENKTDLSSLIYRIIRDG